MHAYDFPPDLLQAQTSWYVAYQRLADAAPATSPTVGRRELLELSARIAAHPFWSGPGGTPAARMELKQLAQREAGR
ncbi:hypothetical protein ACLGI4_01125 [Streptomyces sp. HMX112]|uniref:hypothetical protein n=1 Tax=Streptomyces sp. HMX112 TaxID=3390850 RepID=UPI003A7FFD54